MDKEEVYLGHELSWEEKILRAKANKYTEKLPEVRRDFETEIIIPKVNLLPNGKVELIYKSRL